MPHAVKNQPIPESLMVSLDVMTLRVSLHEMALMPLSQWNDLG